MCAIASHYKYLFTLQMIWMPLQVLLKREQISILKIVAGGLRYISFPIQVIEELKFKRKYINQLKKNLNFISGNLTVIKYLIGNGADVNTTTIEGSTPLHISSNNGNYGYYYSQKSTMQLNKLN